MRPRLFVFSILLVSAFACLSYAAEVTEIAEPSHGKTATFHMDLGYDFNRESGRISKEAYCGPTLSNLCAVGQLRTQREFDYELVEHALDIEAAVGFDVGFELHVNIPVVISEQQSSEFAPGVNGSNSVIDPNLSRVQSDLADYTLGDPGTFFNTYRFFDLTEEGSTYTNRKGIADPSIGFDWLIISQEEKPHLADLLLGFDYTIPIAPVKEGGNSSVGEGLHKFDIQLAASRTFGVVEPFVSVQYSAPVPAGDRSLFGRINENQQTDRPGHHIVNNFGVSFHLLENETTQQSVELQIGGGFSYTTEGLDYISSLFEPLSESECNGITPNEANSSNDGAPYNPDPSSTTPENASCGWVTQQPGNSSSSNFDNRDAAYAHNGLTVEEAHLGYHIRASLAGRFHRNVGARIGFMWRAEANHFLSGANTGEDHNDDGVVNLDPIPNDGRPSERNPIYNPTIDSVGNRFWVEGLRQISIDVALMLYF